MSEVIETVETQTQQAPVETNAFDDGAWSEEPIVAVKKEEIASAITPVIEPVINNANYDSFVKEKFGFDSVEIAETELKRLKEIKPVEEVKFANTESETFYKALLEGKEDDVLNFLSTKKKLERLSTADVTLNTAEEIIKLGLQSKYKDLSPDEINFEFKEQFSYPDKPDQDTDNETDDDYAKRVSKWEEKIKAVQQKIVIEAKKFKPELDKLKTELVLPNIQKPVVTSNEPTEEDKAELQKIRTDYEQALDSDYSKFNGFSVTVKNDDVEVQIPFIVTSEEKEALKNDFKNFDSDDYFGKRWFGEDGKPKVTDMMADKYFLENRDKIIQKAANEAVAQFKEKYIKARGNINITPEPVGTFTPNDATFKEKEEEAIWGA